jgi:aminocarboxymuconate-semialdehyde decarboxylase
MANCIKIDTHTHILPKHVPDFAKKFGYEGFVMLHHHDDDTADMKMGEKFFRRIEANSWNPEIRKEEYAENHTQYQVICTVPVMFAYFSKPKHGLEVAKFLNDDILNTVDKFPKNYIGLGTLPLQDIEHSLEELHRIASLGMHGIQIGSNINDENLSEPKFNPLWEACEKLNMAVMIHPWNMMGFDSIRKYWLPWLVGMPAETARAAASMIFSGVFDRYPKLRVMFSHAGGSLIPTIGRLAHGHRCRPDLVALDNPNSPRDYFGKFWVDSITHDPDLLHYIIRQIGSKRIVLGSDYPFPLGDLKIGRYIEQMGLPTTDVENIFQNAPLEWLGMELKEL